MPRRKKWKESPVAESGRRLHHHQRGLETKQTHMNTVSDAFRCFCDVQEASLSPGGLQRWFKYDLSSSVCSSAPSS